MLTSASRPQAPAAGSPRAPAPGLANGPSGYQPVGSTGWGVCWPATGLLAVLRRPADLGTRGTNDGAPIHMSGPRHAGRACPGRRLSTAASGCRAVTYQNGAPRVEGTGKRPGQLTGAPVSGHSICGYGAVSDELATE